MSREERQLAELRTRDFFRIVDKKIQGVVPLDSRLVTFDKCVLLPGPLFLYNA